MALWTVPVGIKEIAASLGVTTGAVEQWQTRGIGFPAPRGTVSGRRMWDLHLDVLPWAVHTRRVGPPQWCTMYGVDRTGHPAPTPGYGAYVELIRARRMIASQLGRAEHMAREYREYGQDTAVFDVTDEPRYVGSEAGNHLATQPGYITVYRWSTPTSIAESLSRVHRSLCERTIGAAVAALDPIESAIGQRLAVGTLTDDTGETALGAAERLVWELAEDLIVSQEKLPEDAFRDLLHQVVRP